MITNKVKCYRNSINFMWFTIRFTIQRLCLFMNTKVDMRLLKTRNEILNPEHDVNVIHAQYFLLYILTEISEKPNYLTVTGK